MKNKYLKLATFKLKGMSEKAKYGRENMNDKILFAHNKILVTKGPKKAAVEACHFMGEEV